MHLRSSFIHGPLTIRFSCDILASQQLNSTHTALRLVALAVTALREQPDCES